MNLYCTLLKKGGKWKTGNENKKNTSTFSSKTGQVDGI